MLLNPVVDYGAALLLAWGIASALYVRERTGRGQRLDVSLLQAALVMQNNTANHVDAIDGWREAFVPWQRPALADGVSWERSEERRGGKEWFSTCRSRWSAYL